MKSQLSLSISQLKTEEEWITLDMLKSHHPLFGDLRILIDGQQLAGTSPISAGQAPIGGVLETLTNLRQLASPGGKLSRELIFGSGYEYVFEYIVDGAEDILLMRVRENRRAVPGFGEVELDLQQVQTEIRRFRGEFLNLLVQSCGTDKAERWWESNAFEAFNDAHNTPGKY